MGDSADKPNSRREREIDDLYQRFFPKVDLHDAANSGELDSLEVIALSPVKIRANALTD